MANQLRQPDQNIFFLYKDKLILKHQHIIMLTLINGPLFSSTYTHVNTKCCQSSKNPAKTAPQII